MADRKCSACGETAGYQGIIDGLELWWCSNCEQMENIRVEPPRYTCRSCGRPLLSDQEICSNCGISFAV